MATESESEFTIHTIETYITRRWTGISAVALLAAGLAVITRRPALLLASALGVAYVAYAHRGRPPTPSLEFERDVDSTSPDPDDDVEVTVRVRNTGDTTLADLRLVDGVPPGLEVTDGSPRLGTALRPGKRATFSYTVRAVRGEHVWEEIQVLARDTAGTHERELAASAQTEIQCAPSLTAGSDLPLRDLTTQYTGRVPTDVPGSGIEFTTVREYRPGDPQKRIDWNRWARTGERTTVQYREERATTVVLLVDAREEAYVAPASGEQNAVERSVDAAGQLFSTLSGGGDRVGLAAFAPPDCWLAPGAGAAHRAQARELLTTSPAFSPTPPDGMFIGSVRLRRLRRRLSSDAQIILLSPLVDGFARETAQRLDAYGHLVTVVSPDPTVTDTAGHRLAHIERRNRISMLRRTGIRVIDWGDESLASAVANATQRWSR